MTNKNQKVLRQIKAVAHDAAPGSIIPTAVVMCSFALAMMWPV